MRNFRHISVWIIILAGIFSNSVNYVETIPPDHFSFNMIQPHEKADHPFFSEHEIHKILKDRLDLAPKSKTIHLSQHILALCQKYRFDPAFILSLIEVESGFRVGVTSPAGAVGLMQVMVPTANFVLQKVGVHLPNHTSFKMNALHQGVLTSRMLKDPFLNTAIGIAYLAWLRNYYEGLSPYYVLAAYNMGPAKMDKLLSRKSFRPVKTLKYYHSIRRGILKLRRIKI